MLETYLKNKPKKRLFALSNYLYFNDTFNYFNKIKKHQQRTPVHIY